MNSAFQLNGKLIWVVGGAGYLGQAVVTLLSNLGAKLLCIDMENRAVDFVRNAGLEDKVATASFNINDTGFIARFVKEQLALHGSPDGLVNLAFGSTAKKLEELADEDFGKVNHACPRGSIQYDRKGKGKHCIVFQHVWYGIA